MRVGRTLRRIVMNRINLEVPALDGRVYDRVTESVDSPYVTLGPSSWIDDSAECIEAREITLQIDLWGSLTSKGAVEDLTDDVATALHGWSDETALTMHPINVVGADVEDDPDGVSVHGYVTLRAMVEDYG